jgi:uncharacterized protein (TIRG00374 family)
VGYVISAVCIAGLVNFVEWGKFVSAVRSVDWKPLCIGATCVASSYALHAYRWKTLIGHTTEITYRSAFHTLMLGNLLNTFLPLRAGDVFRINRIRKFPEWNSGRALAMIIVERLADLFFLSIVSIILLLNVELPDGISVSLAVVVGTVFLFSVCSFLMAKYRVGVCALMHKVGSLFSENLGSALESQAHHYLDATSIFYKDNHADKVLFTKVCITSIIAWSCHFVAYVFCLKAFDIPDPYTAAMAIGVITNFGLTIPSSPGGLGVYHALVVLALTPWAVATNVGIAVAIVSHVVFYVPMITMGIIAALLKERPE